VLCTDFVLSVEWPLGDKPMLRRPLQDVSRGSLVVINSGSKLILGTAGLLLFCLTFSPLYWFP
jgi:hypothetical protein